MQAFFGLILTQISQFAYFFEHHIFQNGFKTDQFAQQTIQLFVSEHRGSPFIYKFDICIIPREFRFFNEII